MKSFVQILRAFLSFSIKDFVGIRAAGEFQTIN